MRAVKRWFLKWTRTLHIYLSMFALMALFFFAATGFMLNHPAWFDLGEPRRSTAEADLPKDLLLEQIDKLTVVERLRADLHATGLMDTFEIEDQSVRVVFRSPGQTSEFRIERETGHVVAETESFGFLGRLTDLHRGQHVGLPWSMVIDAVSILLLFISVTGLILWISLRRRLLVGVIAGLFGFAGLLVVYFACVP